MGNLTWYDIHPPGSKGRGCLEVEGDFIKRTSPAFRWAVGLHFGDLTRWWEHKGYMLVRRFKENCKSFGTEKVKTGGQMPKDNTLFRRISEKESVDEIFNLGVPL